MITKISKTFLFVITAIIAAATALIIMSSGKMVSDDYGSCMEYEWVTKPRYNYAGNYCEGIATVMEGESYSFLTSKQDNPKKLLLQIKKDEVKSAPDYDNGVLLLYKSAGAYKLYNSTGCKILKQILPESGETLPAPTGDWMLQERITGIQGRYGITGSQRLLVEQPKYGDCEWLSPSYFWASVEDKNYICTYDTHVEIPDEWYPNSIFDTNTLRNADDTIFPLKTENRVTVYADDGKIYLDPLGNAIELGKVTTVDEWFYVDASGSIVIPGPFEAAGYFSEGYAAVSIGGKYGYIDKYGEIVIEPQFSEAGIFSEGYAFVVDENDSFHIVDKQGNLIKCKSIDYGSEFRGNLAVCGNLLTQGLMNTDGKWVLRPRNWSVLPYGDKDWLLRNENQKQGLYLAKPEKYMKLKYDRIEPLTKHLTLLLDDFKCGIINTETGEWVMPMSVGTFGEFGEGLIAAYHPKDMKYGYMNYNGNWIIKPQFENALSFQEGVAAVQVDGKWGYIANPLAPYSWNEDEKVRAESAGITAAITGKNAEDPLTAKDAYLLSEQYIRLVSTDNAEALGAYLEKENGFHQDEELDRQRAAKILTDINQFQDRWTHLYMSFFQDEEEIQKEYGEAVAYAASKGFIKGDLEDNFNPEQDVSIGQFQSMLLRMYEYWR